MKKIITVILAFYVFGCCPASNFSSFSLEDKFVGVWHAGNIKEATLQIIPKDNNIYLLTFENGEFRWEGVGYQNYGNLIAIFRYKNVDEQGFITFTFDNSKRMSYTSRNADGSIRATGYYIKQ